MLHSSSQNITGCSYLAFLKYKHKHLGATGLLYTRSPLTRDLLSCMSDREWLSSSLILLLLSIIMTAPIQKTKTGLEGARQCQSILPWGFCAVGVLGEMEGWGRDLMAGLSWHGLAVGPFFTSRGEHRKSTDPHWYCRAEAGRSGEQRHRVRYYQGMDRCNEISLTHASVTWPDPAAMRRCAVINAVCEWPWAQTVFQDLRQKGWGWGLGGNKDKGQEKRCDTFPLWHYIIS